MRVLTPMLLLLTPILSGCADRTENWHLGQTVGLVLTSAGILFVIWRLIAAEHRDNRRERREERQEDRRPKPS